MCGIGTLSEFPCAEEQAKSLSCGFDSCPDQVEGASPKKKKHEEMLQSIALFGSVCLLLCSFEINAQCQGYLQNVLEKK